MLVLIQSGCDVLTNEGPESVQDVLDHDVFLFCIAVQLVVNIVRAAGKASSVRGKIGGTAPFASSITQGKSFLSGKLMLLSFLTSQPRENLVLLRVLFFWKGHQAVIVIVCQLT